MSGNLLTAREPGSSAVSGSPAPAGLAAMVVTGNEPLRHGLDGLLRSLPNVGSVRSCDPQAFDSLRQVERLDVLVVTAADATWVERSCDRLAETGATVLAVVDQATLDEVSRFPSPPIGGFLWQPTLTGAQLQEFLRTARRGEVAMAPELVKAILAMNSSNARRSAVGAARLTGREREALSLLVQGMSNKQIARRLSISSHGAKRLVASIMLKLDAPNRTLAAVTAIREKVVDSD